MRNLFFGLLIFFSSCVSENNKEKVLAEKWFKYKSGNEKGCLCKIKFVNPSRVNYYDYKGDVFEKDQYVLKKNWVFIISRSSLYNEYLKQRIDYANVFFTKNNICVMHTLIKKRNIFFVYSIDKIVNDSTIEGKEVDFYKFKKGFASIESYIEFLTINQSIPLFKSYDFIRFGYHDCRLKWKGYYTDGKTDTAMDASFNEIKGENCGLILLGIRKIRSAFPNYEFY